MSLARVQDDLLVGMGAPAAGPGDRRGVPAAVPVVPVARLGRAADCARGCGPSSRSARCKARSAGGWWPPASPSASRSRSIGWRRISCSPALIFAAIVWTAQRLGRARVPLSSRRCARAGIRAERDRAGGAGARCRSISARWSPACAPGCLQHLAADRRRVRAGCGAAVLRHAAVAQFLREHADRAVRSSHAGLCDLVVSRSLHAIDVAARGEGRGAVRGALALLAARHAAGGARHLDAAAVSAALARAAASGDGDAGADRGDRACGSVAAAASSTPSNAAAPHRGEFGANARP